MKIKQLMLYLVMFIQATFLSGQYVNWSSFDTLINNSVNAIYYDSTDGSTYIGGFFYRIDADTLWGVGKYQNGQWFRMGNGINWDRNSPFCATCWPNPVRDIIKYHDTLWMAVGNGAFFAPNALGAIRNYAINNNILYLGGSFNVCNSTTAYNIIRYEGKMKVSDIAVSDYGYIFLTGSYDSEINQSLPDYCSVPTNGEFVFCDFNGNAYMETDINGNTGEPLDSVHFQRTFITCFDNNGVLSWSTRYGNGRNNIARSIHVHGNDKLYIAGYAQDPVTTDNYPYTLEDLNTATLTDYFQSNYGNNSYDAVAARFSIPMLTIGIDENETFNQGKVFPNPTTDIVYVSIPNYGDTESYPYTVMDLSGRIISNGNLLGTLPSIDLNGLANGLYIINVNVKSRIFTFKVIKQ